MKNQNETRMCACGTTTKPKKFFFWGFEVQGSECPKCGNAYLSDQDVAKLLEYKKENEAGKRVLC